MFIPGDLWRNLSYRVSFFSDSILKKGSKTKPIPHP